ncbi:MAG: M1 family aminopeptidase, partial [Flavobacteriales bacterium]|nr:M1 family aminopeptidase [Flavobacteriales bacterium]
GERKIWKFHAENVHDFSFTADPTYRIGEAWWQDKVCYSLAQEPHASKWQNAAEYAAEIIKVFSEDFGRYTYHKMIVADARSGMEYPMMTLDGGQDPSYRGLLVHEIGHNWFFGQVGNNETYRALLDEGFTQFLTAWGLIKIDGDYLVSNTPKSKYKQKFKEETKAIDSRVFYAYINDATKYNDPVISTHSDGFNGALKHGGGYRHVYYKTASMLYNLQYVLGDELFLDAMKHYFGTWKIAHPYNEDFRNAIIQYTKVDLNWFFDQWLDTDKRIDYSVKKKGNMVTFERKSRMQMPIDFRVIANDGKTYDYHIPNHWFVKETDATVLEKWHAWDLIQPTYTTEINVPSGIKEVIIDPTQRLADAYMPDNSSKCNTTFTFNDNLWKYPDWKNYELKYQPNMWYNSTDGLKIGMNLKGGYMNHHHVFDATFWMNSGINQDQTTENYSDYDDLSYRFNYKTNLDNISLNSKVEVNSSHIAGLSNNSVSLTKSGISDKNKIKLTAVSYLRNVNSSDNYIVNDSWNKGKFNNRIDIDIEHKYNYSYGKGKVNLSLKSSTLGSDYDYSSLSLTSINNNKIGRIKVNTRSYFQLGRGTDWAPESKLYLSGANPEELSTNKFTRTNGIINSDDVAFTNEIGCYQMGGGLNLRGYTGYLAPEYNENGELIKNTNYGTSGASFTAEIDVTSYLPYSLIRTGIGTYLFADAGIINIEEVNSKNYLDAFSDLRADAGIGFTYTHRNWGPLETINPLVIRLDLPLFLNRPPYEEEYTQMRWLIGIGKTF